MSFDPTIPQANTDLDAVPIRNNFNELKTLIDNIPPPPPTLKSGTDVLDGSGTLDLSAIITSGYFVAMFTVVTGIGPLTFQSAPYRIVSAAGAADAGKGVVWIAF